MSRVVAVLVMLVLCTAYVGILDSYGVGFWARTLTMGLVVVATNIFNAVILRKRVP